MATPPAINVVTITLTTLVAAITTLQAAAASSRERDVGAVTAAAPPRQW
jgi:hypothetical protein